MVVAVAIVAVVVVAAALVARRIDGIFVVVAFIIADIGIVVVVVPGDGGFAGMTIGMATVMGVVVMHVIAVA